MTDPRAMLVLERLSAVHPLDEHPGRLPPVDELVCTILSQNTSDANRDKGFARLRETYASWQDVVDAPTEAIADCIRIAGLPTRKAPTIQRALRAVAERTGGHYHLDFLRELPRDEARGWLTSIEGVGIKTASIVLLFGLEMPALPVDTHVHRVAGRIGLIPPGTNAERAHHVLEEAVPPEDYLRFHVALIRHGRTVCRAPRPLCEACPLTDVCDYYRSLASADPA